MNYEFSLENSLEKRPQMFLDPALDESQLFFGSEDLLLKELNCRQ
jgi:hypothetical protein